MANKYQTYMCWGEECKKKDRCLLYRRHQDDVTNAHGWFVDEKECIKKGYFRFYSVK